MNGIDLPRGQRLDFDGGPLVMGVVNANRDSFSDPRRDDAPTRVLELAHGLLDAGADLLDVGGQTASPAVAEISQAEELDRILPVVEALSAAFPRVPVSIDTYRPEVAESALAAGATVVNNIIGADHVAFAELATRHGAAHVITHNPGPPKTKLLEDDLYGDVVGDVTGYFRSQLEAISHIPGATALAIIDPGVDLAKTPAQSLELLRRGDEFDALGRPVLMAISRKDVIGVMTERRPADRTAGTLAAVGHLRQGGQRIFRLHDVAAARDLLTVYRFLDGQATLPSDARLDASLRRQDAGG